MVSTVAQKRLFHEYKNLSTNPPEGITAGPVSEDDMFYWEALIQGPEETPFEGGVFAAELKFPRDYPLSPPTMKFIGGGIWHPNGTSPRCAGYTNGEYLANDPVHSLSQRHCLHLYSSPAW
jgi:ubiquitin-protein ligase